MRNSSFGRLPVQLQQARQSTAAAENGESFPIFPLLQCPELIFPKRSSATPTLPKINSKALVSSVVDTSPNSEAGITSQSPAIRPGRRSDRDSRNSFLYSPVQFDIHPPDKLPYMGTDYRQIGKVRKVSCESSAVKKNEVRHRQLTREQWGIVRCSDRTKKDFTRTLLMWHREFERGKNHQDSAQERRTQRILKFLDTVSNMSEFHFKESFFQDLKDPRYDPDPSPPPVRPDAKRPLITRSEKMQTSGSFRRPDPKKEAIKAKFADCSRAAEVSGSGYTYVKIYTDPYYRYLPPLSAASKNFDMKVARLPHKELRNEEQWEKFLESLKPKKATPIKQDNTPDYDAINMERRDLLRRRLPIITMLPKWLQKVRDKNDIKSARYDGIDIYEDCLNSDREASKVVLQGKQQTRRKRSSRTARSSGGSATNSAGAKNIESEISAVREKTVSPVKIPKRSSIVRSSRKGATENSSTKKGGIEVRKSQGAAAAKVVPIR